MCIRDSVIGLPGETVTIEDGQVYIDGEALDEDYLKSNQSGEDPWTVNACLLYTSLAAIMDTSDEWISSRTGIRNRHSATTETTTSLACDAVKSALQDAGIDGSEIDLSLIHIFSARLLPYHKK